MNYQLIKTKVCEGKHTASTKTKLGQVYMGNKYSILNGVFEQKEYVDRINANDNKCNCEWSVKEVE